MTQFGETPLYYLIQCKYLVLLPLMEIFPINLFVFPGVQAQIAVELYLKSYFTDFLMQILL